MEHRITDSLDFSALDDFAFALQRERAQWSEASSFAPSSLGPLLELGQLSGSLDELLRKGYVASAGPLGPLITALSAGNQRWTAPDGKLLGYLRTQAVLPSDASVWTGFGLDAQRAAMSAGFSKPIASQLSAALRELHDNIYEHAGASSTGIVAYRAAGQTFEIVASDVGQGVLRTLSMNSDYRNLQDYGEALRLTLTDGVSRFGSSSGRGRGFRPIFTGLANLNGSLRFRSGDHALTIDGTEVSLVRARISQKPPLKGFLASVVCGA